MSKRDYHVFRKDDGKWHVRRQGARRSASIHATQRDADRRAGELARRSRGERVTHGVDGRIRSKDSFGDDPRGVRDTEH